MMVYKTNDMDTLNNSEKISGNNVFKNDEALNDELLKLKTTMDKNSDTASKQTSSQINLFCKPDFECDMHCHTNRSDGNDTPKELIDKAAQYGMKAIAITDHDINPPQTITDDSVNEIPIKQYGKKLNISIILGYEFSCDTFVDDVHILGYELDWNNDLLKNEISRARTSKTEAYRKLCEALTLNGMPIDFNMDILTYSDKNGNLCKRNPDEVERKHIFEVMALKKYAKTWQEAKLMVRDNPYLNIRRKKISPSDAIKLIKHLNGIAVLAHPYLIDETVDSKVFGCILARDKYIDKLIIAGLDGIESMYTYNKTSYKGNLSPMKIKKEVEDKFKDKVKFFTGGSDYHNDAKKGVKNPRKIGEAGISFTDFKNIFKNYL